MATIRAIKQLVAASYLLTDSFSSSLDDREWLRGFSYSRDARVAVPEFLTDDSRALRLDRLADCYLTPQQPGGRLQDRRTRSGDAARASRANQ